MLEKMVIWERLKQSERHVTQSTQHVHEQEARIVSLELGGNDTTRSRALLKTFRESLRLHSEGRDRLLDELAALQ